MATTAEHTNGAVHEVGAKAEEALRRKAGQLQKFFDDVEDLLQRVSSMDDPDISRLRNRIESSIERVKNGARDGARAAINGTRDAALATDEYVHRQPWVAIGATAAIGLLMGALLRGSRK